MKKNDIWLKIGKVCLIIIFFVLGSLVAKMIFSLFLEQR